MVFGNNLKKVIATEPDKEYSFRLNVLPSYRNAGMIPGTQFSTGTNGGCLCSKQVAGIDYSSLLCQKNKVGILNTDDRQHLICHES